MRMNGKNAEALIVLRNILKNPTFRALADYAEGRQNFCELAARLMNEGCECDLLGWLQELVLCDENAFSLCCAAGGDPSEYVKAAYLNDLEIIFNLAKNLQTHDMFAIGALTSPFDCGNFNETVDHLCSFYRKHGCGIYIKNSAFVFKDGKLVKVCSPSPVTLDKLKNYSREKKIIENNILNFLNGLPYADMLLYGDRGTGKSSTVHAMLNAYTDSGLRLIEISKEQILLLPEVRQIVARLPLKFIIFIDDLSLDEYDEKTSSLKASIEGSVCGGASNTMLVATSNRRHIVKETFDDRKNSVHASDSMEEQLSLSDRFGITVMFSSTDKAQYLSIVKQLADDICLNIDETELYAIAERWALVKGGRSPRRAKQIVDMLQSCKIRGETIDF